MMDTIKISQGAIFKSRIGDDAQLDVVTASMIQVQVCPWILVYSKGLTAAVCTVFC